MILKDHHPAKSSSKLFFPDRCNINLRNWQWVQRKMTNNNWLHHQKITMRMPFTWLRPIIRNCNYFLPVSEWLAFCFCSMSNSSLAIIFFLSSSPISTFLPDPKLLIWLWYPTVMHSIFFATHHIVISSWHSMYLWSNKEHNGELNENRKVQEVQPGPDQTLDHRVDLVFVIGLKYQIWYYYCKLSNIIQIFNHLSLNLFIFAVAQSSAVHEGGGGQ